MKSSVNEGRRRPWKCLVVDGYNVVARARKSALRDVDDIDAARDELLDWLSEYAAFSGEDVVVVFDAHHTPERAKAVTRAGISIIYTAGGETADDVIERMVYDLRDTYRQISVATSDAAEQQVAFGGGALRISADGLLRRLAEIRRQIGNAVSTHDEAASPRLGDRVRQDVAKILEKWRRDQL